MFNIILLLSTVVIVTTASAEQVLGANITSSKVITNEKRGIALQSLVLISDSTQDKSLSDEMKLLFKWRDYETRKERTATCRNKLSVYDKVDYYDSYIPCRDTYLKVIEEDVFRDDAFGKTITFDCDKLTDYNA